MVESGSSVAGDASSNNHLLRHPVLTLALVVLGGIGIALLIIEIGFRILFSGGAHDRREALERPRSYFLPEESSYNRDYVYPKIKPPGAFRVAAIGDSFTFGPHLQFDDTYPKRLERWLNLNRSAPPVEVLNLGSPGASTATEVAAVRRAAAKGADLILLQITLNDAEARCMTKAERDQIFGNPFATSKILHYWRSLGYLVQRFYQARGRKRTERYFAELFEDPHLWGQFSHSLELMKYEASKRNVPLVATIFPLFGFSFDKAYPYFDVHDKIGKELARNGIPYLDLLPSFRGLRTERLETILGSDPHPNEIAHRIAAEGLYRWLKGVKLLPSAVFAKSKLRSRERTR